MKEKLTQKNGIYIYALMALIFVFGVIYYTSKLVVPQGMDASGMLIPIIPIVIMFGLFMDILLNKK